MRPQEIHPTTVLLNRKQKNLAKKARHDALAWLEATFPDIFDTSIRIRPLKIGIMADILDYVVENKIVHLSKSKLREAIVVFTRRVDYLTCLKSREKRVDLAGNVGEEVTEEEAEHASQKIKKRVEKSAKNARRALTSKVMGPGKTPAHFKPHSHHVSAQPDFSAYHYNQSQGYVTPSVTPTRSASPSVMVKHKAPRTYDPSAVARLKEKLGLSRRKEESGEVLLEE
jgi:ProP effector